jgi:pyochelin biosynthetic protein PchC
VRVLCVPHAGSGASPYVSWGRRFPDDIEFRIVAPPGREQRIAEPPVRDLEEYAAGLVAGILREPELPWIVFGHSFGAIVAYEVARRLTEAGHPPAHLVVSARGIPTDLPPARPMHALPDDDLVSLMRRQYGGFAAEVEHFPELLAEVLTALRLDLALMETFRPRFEPILPIPVSVFWSPDDPSAVAEDIEAWRRVSSHPVRFEAFPGGHFYLFARAEDLVARLVEAASGCPVPGRCAPGGMSA